MILEESLKYIKDNLPQIERILVTCDEDNIGSQKTIKRNAGVLDNIISLSDAKRKMRYWIHL